MSKKIKCCCQISFNEYVFKEHFLKCKSFKEKFKDFDNKLSLLLKEYNNIEDLNYIKYLLKSFIKLIDYKIKESKGKQIKKEDSIIDKINEFNNNSSIIIEKVKSKNAYHYSKFLFKSIFSLNSMRNWFNSKNNVKGNKFESKLIKIFYNELNNFYKNNYINYQNILDLIIDLYEKKYNLLYKEKIPDEPYYLLNYFIQFLHSDNIHTNQIKTLKYESKSIDNNNINNEYDKLYKTFLEKTENRIIKFFFNIIRNYTFCEKCRFELEFYEENILTLDLSSSQELKNINLDSYLKNFFGHNTIQCKNCQNPNVIEKKKIFYPSDVLIIYFKRSFHSYKCDIEFPIVLTLNNDNIFCTYTVENIINNPEYILKSCISFCRNNKYIVYNYINEIWYKYIDDEQEKIQNNKNEIYEFEPQILIYELNLEKNRKINEKLYDINNSLYNSINL